MCNMAEYPPSGKASNFHETTPMMYFRPSEYIEIAGGRFTDLPEKVEFSAEGFLKVFEDAVNGQLKKTTKTVEELKVEEQEKREEKVQEFVDSLEHPDKLYAQVEEIISTMTQEQKQKAAVEFTKLSGVGNYKQEQGNAENLKKALEALEIIVG